MIPILEAQRRQVVVIRAKGPGSFDNTPHSRNQLGFQIFTHRRFQRAIQNAREGSSHIFHVGSHLAMRSAARLDRIGIREALAEHVEARTDVGTRVLTQQSLDGLRGSNQERLRHVQGRLVDNGLFVLVAGDGSSILQTLCEDRADGRLARYCIGSAS